MNCLIICVVLIFISCKSWGLPLNKILQANDARSLNLFITKNKRISFLKSLCERQKAKKKPPTACYELSFHVDSWCVQLRLKDLELPNVKKALESKFLSAICREHLEAQKKILIYRKKDFLIPELKKYWTESKTFF